MARDITTARSFSTSDSGDYPPSRYEDIKRSDVTSITAFVQPREAPKPDMPEPTTKTLPIISMAATSLTGIGGVPVQGQLFPPTRPQVEAPIPDQGPVGVRPTLKQKRSLFDLKGGPATNLKVMKVTISHPILEENGDQNPLNKIATIDLETAARNEKERRANDLQRASALIATPASCSASTAG